MDTLHIKLDHSFNLELKRLAKHRSLTVSDLIRQALVSCYQLEFLGLPDKQKQALEAYRGGFISIGKLSESMGLTILELREWFNEHHIPQNSAYTQDDVTNAL